MFTTLRTEQKDGEIICISSSNQPPRSGQNHISIACDGCRSKKLKCSAHRFGCQRCRERGLVCTYSNGSQAKRRRLRRGELACSSAESNGAAPSTANAGSEEGRCGQKSQVLASATNDGRSRFGTSSDSSGIGGDEYAQTVRSGSDSSGSTSFQSSGRPPHISPNHDELQPSGVLSGSMFQDTMETEFADFGFVDLLDPDLQMSDGGPADRTVDGMGTQPELPPPSPSLALISEKRNNCPSSSGLDDMDSAIASQSYRRADFRRVRRLSTPIIDSRQSPYSSPNITRCQCMGVTLGMIERIQSHSQITNLTLAEDSLYLLKKSIRQHQVLSQCRICKPTSKLMTFSILLVEKMVVILKAIAAKWEYEMMSHEPDRIVPACQADGCGNDAILVGAYPVDTARERGELFGFLISLQAKNLSVLQEDLVSTARREDWDIHLNALRSVGLTLQHLRETLFEITMELSP